ncbi:hypothetical protein BGX23_001938 [Mortierella sp. AD031]|nr:hypothetical protein BGX23_001938 [Mortierella sp. AD031]
MTATNCAYNNNNDHNEAGFSVLTHPAVIYSNKRLLDPKEVSQLHTVHVIDFDQTLFRSPTPNPTLWDPYFLSRLTSWDEIGAGWWLTRGTLELGQEVEDSVWDGWWNEELVPVVRESAKDPGCLTILLTGRNSALYGDILLRMLQAKKLDFDLVATKPSIVARLHDKTEEETYLKLHTFSTKREFLYNVLLEYPSLRSMKVWDDRRGQVAQFRQAGQVWIEQGMLESFEIVHVIIPFRTLEREDEVRLVRSMVEVHNRQVEFEAQGGGFMVTGVGEMPRKRPELKDVEGMWDPYWEYVPERRTRIELIDVIQYTGVTFSESTQALLRGFARGGGLSQEPDGWMIQPPLALQGTDLSLWTPAKEFYIFLCARKGSPQIRQAMGGIGATVFVVVEAVGQIEGKAWALKVRGVHSRSLHGYKVLAPDGKIFPSVKSYLAAHPVKRFGNVVVKRQGDKPYITMAYDQSKGGRAADAGKISNWEPLDFSSSSAATISGRTGGKGQKIVLVGTISEKVLIGSKMPKFGHLATIPRAEIHIPQLVKNYTAERKLEISGQILGETLKAIENEMKRLSVANKQSNHDQVFEIVHRICAQLHSSSNGSS